MVHFVWMLSLCRAINNLVNDISVLMNVLVNDLDMVIKTNLVQCVRSVIVVDFQSCCSCSFMKFE